MTKFRIHLLTKCTQISEEVKEMLSKEVGLFQKNLTKITVNQDGEVIMEEEDEKVRFSDVGNKYVDNASFFI